MIPNARSEYSEHYFREYHSVIPKSTYPIAWSYYNLLPSHWLAIWRIFRRSPLSEEKYPNRNPAWKQALLIIDFQWFTRKGSSTSLSAKTTENQRFTLVFLFPFANEARFSERDGYKKYRTLKADWFSNVFGRAPTQGIF